MLFFSIFPTIPAANNLALVLKLQGELNESKELFAMAFAIAESALGNRHVWTAAVAGNLGDVLQLRGELRRVGPPPRLADLDHVPKCKDGTPVEDCVHTITSHNQVRDFASS